MDNKYTQAWTTLVFSLASSSPLCVASLRRWRFSPVGLICGQKVAHFIPIINEETFVFWLHNNDSALANHEIG